MNTCRKDHFIARFAIKSLFENRDLITHLSDKHTPKELSSAKFACKYCPQYYNRSFDTNEELHKHYIETHADIMEAVSEKKVILLPFKAAFNRNVVSYRTNFESINTSMTIEEAFLVSEKAITQKLKAYADNSNPNFKMTIILFAKCNSVSPSGQVVDSSSVVLRPQANTLVNPTVRNIKNVIQRSRSDLLARLAGLNTEGSHYTSQGITDLHLELAPIRLTGGCQDRKTKKLLLTMKGKQWLSDMPSPKDECFFYAIAQFLCPRPVINGKIKHWWQTDKSYNEQIKSYLKQIIDTKDIPTPVAVKDIKLFEQRNKYLFLAINVFLYDKTNGIIQVVRRSKLQSNDKIKFKRVNLLMLPTSKDDQFHYVLIKDIDRFMRARHQKRTRVFVCDNCLVSFSRKAALEKHRELCLKQDFVTISAKPEGARTTFTATEKVVPSPIWGVMDFEACMDIKNREDNAILFKCEVCAQDDNPKLCHHGTSVMAEHVPTTYSMIFFDDADNIIFQRCKSKDDNLIQEFYKDLYEAQETLLPLMNINKDSMRLSTADQFNFRNASKCYLCSQPFTETDPSVRDHQHGFTTKLTNYLGAAHNSCNLNRRHETKISLYAHNLVRYDINFLLKDYAPFKYFNAEGVEKEVNFSFDALPRNTEKFRTLNIGGFKCFDSLALLSGSLASLVNNLQTGGHDFKIIEQLDFCTDDTDKALLLRKGEYPYNWATSVKLLRETTVLPSKECFFNDLRETHIEQSNYDHACEVFNRFECDNMLEYCETYCILDTALLAECLSSFRKFIYKTFHLDMVKYISLPQLTFDCFLKTCFELEMAQPTEALKKNYVMELCSDPEMNLFFESSVRGGTSYTSTRLFDINATDLGRKLMEHLLYLDANNLYGVCMLHPLPNNGFEWVKEEEISTIDFQSMSFKQPQGYFLEVDMSYPIELHKSHSQFPILAAHECITFEDLSPYAKASLIALEGEKVAARHKSVKLMTSFLPKKKYIMHYMNFKQALDLGLVCDKIHRVVKFNQFPFIKYYVELLTDMRTKAKTEFQKNLLKLMVNAIFGKLISDVRKFLEVKICRTLKKAEKYISNPRYMTHKIVSEEMVIVYLKQRLITSPKNFAAGTTILNIAKYWMINFYYNDLLPNVGGYENVSLMFHDTDSFCVIISGMYRDKIWENLQDFMDFSNFPKDSPFYSERFKKKPGKFKDENGNEPIDRAVALKSKCYVLLSESLNELKRCKGINTERTASFTFELYKQCIEHVTKVFTNVRSIRAKHNVLRTVELRKVALTSFDNKRWMKNCGVHSVPYGSVHSTEDCDLCPLASLDDLETNAVELWYNGT